MEPLVSTSEAEFGALGPDDEPSSGSASRPRAPWTPIEHEVFLQALAAHGRDWRRVSAVLQEAATGRGDLGAARSLAQVRYWGGGEGASGRFRCRERGRGELNERRFLLFPLVLAREIYFRCSPFGCLSGRVARLFLPEFG